MRFWNLLGWIIGVPFVLLFGGAALYCIFYAIGKMFWGVWDFLKYPRYYWDSFKKRFKKHYKDIILYIIGYIILGAIVYLIYIFID